MSALKKIILAPVALVALAVSVQAMAQQERKTIQLEATIPSLEFHVEPVDNSWIGTPQVLGWNPIAGSLDTLRKQFFAKHTAGSIEASLLNTAELQSIVGNDKIDLEVSFNNKALSTTGVEVLTEAEAEQGSTVWLEIKPTTPAGGYVAGNYEGNVQLAFDAVLAP
ncbi:fimbrial protein [Pseudomonas sp. GD03860]|uniref:CS1 type fimbrial major subunit n=1 Tax=Pseudomonas TaxID=286 RepID=UPI0023634104|nr:MULTISPECIES: CS1 type fimbrial major subunit [Pseudomonas]MDD2058623.1 fimbrial protein [Pseudomonas putida]MDH0636856.1 fimbrial protein [Pseudomonas sp. GD03860]